MFQNDKAIQVLPRLGYLDGRLLRDNNPVEAIDDRMVSPEGPERCGPELPGDVTLFV